MAVTVNGLNGVTFNNGSLQTAAAAGTNDQTWQVFTGSRAVDVTYTNTTGRPIMVCVNFTPAGGGGPGSIAVNGVLAAYGACVQNVSEGGITTMVPAGAQYVYSGKPISVWTELR
jgi:hypothetical protein